MLCFPNYSAWPRGWDKGRKITFLCFFSFCGEERLSFKGTISPGKQNFLGVKALRGSREKQQEAFYAFRSFYKPNLVLCLLCPKLAPNCRLSS